MLAPEILQPVLIIGKIFHCSRGNKKNNILKLLLGEGSRESGQKSGKDYILTSYVFMYDQGKLREATDN